MGWPADQYSDEPQIDTEMASIVFRAMRIRDCLGIIKAECVEIQHVVDRRGKRGHEAAEFAGRVERGVDEMQAWLKALLGG